ncbi:transcriptional regulator GutM [Alkalibacter rhizosphaerae]|uniref:Transcriptional regulator GutM n=1 Tax=Alkalibacter rhizosphaerae TaxID=2815577 RepID=A0A975AHZ3_9FIRM|nr:transcriptional regulator GutM [Alkalibacter rhizosphaerae]QSX08947.1 transcriptional regulator GutM [Alkalibacter rhizosphaerae]
MDNMVKLVFVFFGMMVVQGGMTFFQIKNYQKNAKEIRMIGDMLVGQAKGGFKPGCIVMMALDPDGNILETRCMLGRTVLHKFKVIHDFDGRNVFETDPWVKKIKSEQLKKAVKTAITTMMEQLEAKKLADLEALEDETSTDSVTE